MIRLFLFAILLVLFSCSEKPSFQFEKVFENEQWSQADSISFKIPVEDTTQLHDLILELEHSEDFQYQNLYLKVRTAFPEGKPIENILPIDLADKFGNWQGECRGGDCSADILLRKSFKFQTQGDYEFDFIQYSRDSILKDIKSVKLALYQSK